MRNNKDNWIRVVHPDFLKTYFCNDTILRTAILDYKQHLTKLHPWTKGLIKVCSFLAELQQKTFL